MRRAFSLLRTAVLVTTAAAALLTAGSLAACAWSVPADPGMNARQRAGLDVVPAASGPVRGGVPAAARGGSGSGARFDDGARTVYLDRCARCHEPFSPRHASPDEWPGIVRKMGPRAGLFGAERQRVVEWLQANAR